MSELPLCRSADIGVYTVDHWCKRSCWRLICMCDRRMCSRLWRHNQHFQTSHFCCLDFGGSFASCLHSTFSRTLISKEQNPFFHDASPLYTWSRSDLAVSRNILALLFIILFCSARFWLRRKLTRPATKEDNEHTALSPLCSLKQHYGLRKLFQFQ